MPSMIEAVARKFAADEGWDWEQLHETEDTSFGWSRDHIRRRVRSTVEAMRTPTGTMVMMAQTAPVDLNPGLGVPDDFSARFRGDPKAAAASVWDSMIAGALMDESEPAELEIDAAGRPIVPF